MLATLATLEGLMGSREDALSMLRRCLRLVTTGTELRRNFGALACAAGSREAAWCALLTTPMLLALDFGQPAFAARLDFWCGQLGLTAGEVLQQRGTLLKSRLDRVTPRWAWVQRHRPHHGLGAGNIHRADAERKKCMAKYGVPLAGFAEFQGGLAGVGGGADSVPARA